MFLIHFVSGSAWPWQKVAKPQLLLISEQWVISVQASKNNLCPLGHGVINQRVHLKASVRGFVTKKLCLVKISKVT